MKTLLIINPLSGGGEGGSSRLYRCLKRAFPGAETACAEGLEEIGRLASEAARSGGFEAVVVCGGDGSVNAAMNALAGTGLPLGIIPCGTGNDLARSLGLPLEVEEACRLLPKMRPRPVDLIRVNGGRLYATVGHVGSIARASAWHRRYRAKAPWWLTYGAALGLSVVSGEAFQAEVEGQGFSFRGRALAVVAANTPLMGRYFQVASDARLDDGLMQVRVLQAGGGWRLLAAAVSSVKGRLECRPGILKGRARELKLSTDPPLELWADGELMGVTPVVLEVEKGILRVMAYPSGCANP